jgi:hypothetical protein
MDHTPRTFQWSDALRLEREGDPSALVDLLVLGVPSSAQERVAAVLRKLPRRKPPTQKTIRLARAVVHFEKHEGTMRFEDLLSTTCREFKIKDTDVLQNALDRHRSDVNPLLAEWGWEKPNW